MTRIACLSERETQNRAQKQRGSHEKSASRPDDGRPRIRREAFRRLVGGLARAERLVSADPAAAFAALRGRFPSEDASRLRAQWSAIRPQLGLQNLLVTVLEREAEWLHASGRVSGPAPDFRRVLAPQILDAVEPDAVTFIAR